MSRTKRKILSRGKEYGDDLFMDEVDDTAAKHRKVKYGQGNKMKPYTKGFKFKEIPSDSSLGRTSKTSRDNVNRSYKKGLRQQLKKLTQEEFALIKAEDDFEL